MRHVDEMSACEGGRVNAEDTRGTTLKRRTKYDSSRGAVHARNSGPLAFVHCTEIALGALEWENISAVVGRCRVVRALEPAIAVG